MKQTSSPGQSSTHSEYDFSKGERGRYGRRYAHGSNVVVLAPDVAKVFPTSKAVNASLRKLIRSEGEGLKK